MLRNLLAVFSGTPVLTAAVADFQEMLELARTMVQEASRPHPEAGAKPDLLAEHDTRMNNLQRLVRRRVIMHLAGSVPSDAEFCLTLMGLVKDLERVGDYAKNLVRLPAIVGEAGSAPLSDDPLELEISAFADEIVAFANGLPEVYADADPARVSELVTAARGRSRVSDALVRQVAAGAYDAATATRMTLTIRFYRRINSHLASVLTSLRVNGAARPEPAPRAVAG